MKVAASILSHKWLALLSYENLRGIWGAATVQPRLDGEATWVSLPFNIGAMTVQPKLDGDRTCVPCMGQISASARALILRRQFDRAITSMVLGDMTISG